MFFESGTEVNIEIFELQKGRKYRIKTQNMSSPILYIGNINTEFLTGEAFLYNNEVIIVDTNISVSETINKILKNYDKYNEKTNKLEVDGNIIGHLDFESIYNQTKDTFILRDINNAKYNLDLQLDYKKKYDEEVIKTEKYQTLIKKYIGIQSDITKLIKELEEI